MALFPPRRGCERRSVHFRGSPGTSVRVRFPASRAIMIPVSSSAMKTSLVMLVAALVALALLASSLDTLFPHQMRQTWAARVYDRD